MLPPQVFPNPQLNRILLVDDSKFMIRLLEETLAGQNYIVDIAQSGHEALELMETQNFDVVLLDVHMPDMDGFEVCKKIKNYKQHADLPIIFVTSDEENVVKGLLAGAVDYIGKSHSNKELLARINTHIKLRNTQKALKDLNLYLEEKVNERTEQLEQALKDLDTFFYRASHDMRSPLTTLRGIIKLLRKDTQSNELEEIKELLSLQLGKIEGLNRSIIEVGNIRSRDITKVPINVAEIIREIVNESKTPGFEFFIQGNLNLQMQTDPYLLRKGILPLVENVIRHANPGKDKDPVFCHIHLESFENTNIIRIYDNGVGIPYEAQNQLFNMFFRASNSFNNYGMGLYKAKLAIERIAGCIRFRPLSNKNGTCFEIDLPS